MGEQVIDWHDRSLWTVGRPREVDEFTAEGHGLFDGSVSWPALVLRDAVLRCNIDTMAAYVQRHGVFLAPHGKTSMAPALFRMQLAAGAWGITVATPFQAMIALRAGVPRVVLANEVLDGAALKRILEVRDAAERSLHAGVEVFCFVDSIEGIRVLDECVQSSETRRVFPVLLDVGYSGGRTGVRTTAEALELAKAIDRTSGVELVGTACYEGALPGIAEASEFLAKLRGVTESLIANGYVNAENSGPSPIVSAGGSAFFDLVVSELGGRWAEAHDVQVILRSGAYVTHDDGIYAQRTPFARLEGEGEFGPALELWAQVVSTPEPDLAIVNIGKRDAPFDMGLPVPKLLRRAGADCAEPIAAVAKCTKLNDQHGYVDIPESFGVRPGDLICFGISHPCTAFDRWRALPVVDCDDRIVDVMHTYF